MGQGLGMARRTEEVENLKNPVVDCYVFHQVLLLIAINRPTAAQ